MHEPDILESFFKSQGLSVSQVAIRLGLDRAQRTAQKMNLLSTPAKILVVGGTNGKGSTLRTVERYLCLAGFRVGLYTSPHLIRYNERVRIQSVSVSDQLLSQYFEAVLEASDKHDPLSYFEFATLSALYCFKQAALDFILLEVGLGGRLDAVNIVCADVAVISSIALDHMAYLGDSLEKIGYEKAGILRANQPVICGAFPCPESIINTATALNASLILLDQLDFSERESDWCFEQFDHLPKPQLNLRSCAMALKAISLLGIVLSRELLEKTLNGLFLSGRIHEVTYLKHHLLLDVAHNEEAALNLAVYVQQKYGHLIQHKKVFAVFGVMQDKMLAPILAPFRQMITQWVIADLATPRALCAENIKNYMSSHDFQSVQVEASPEQALEASLKVLPEEGLLICFGSFYLVGPLLQHCGVMSD